MARPEPAAVSRVGLVGVGTIGGGWALHFLRHGKDVAVFDPGPQSADALSRLVDRAWPVMEELGLAPGADPGRLSVVSSLEDVIAGAEVVQESAPDNLAAKVKLFAEMDAIAGPDVPIVSSTSGFAMTDIQADCKHPGRTVIGHPFNPPYLMPLVEVVGGELSDAEVVNWTAAFYAATGKRVITMRREVPGFIANRLQGAMRAEALHMIAAGEATVEEIDIAVANGPGLRWAIMGPIMIQHLAGGEGGIVHSLDGYLKLTLKEPRTRLRPPEISDELREALVAGCAREAAGRSVAEIARERDACLVAILKALESCRSGGEGGL